MTTQARTKSYDESYESESVRVEIEWTGDAAEYRVWHCGYPGAVYVGGSVQQAEIASGLSADEWQELLSENIADLELGTHDYCFGTDSGLGTITAYSWKDACDQLRKMLPDAAIENGGFGWVENDNGERYEIGSK